MRSVLIIFGIALLILGVSFLFTPRKGLVDDPAEEQYRKQQEYDRKEQEEAKKTAANSPKTSSSAGQPEKSPAPSSASASTKFEPYKLPAQGNVTAVMSVKNRGDITFELFAKDAPKTVAQIAGLMKSGFYDGIIFHRVVPDFVVQAGNPATKTQGADAQESAGGVPPIPFESNKLEHATGTLGIALTAPKSETGTSQFFINLKPNHSLDGDYCVFGKVTAGMDVVNKIEKGDVITKVVVK